MKTGVVVGRFQIDDLHEGHEYVLDQVKQRCEKLVIVIGDSPLCLTDKNPLSFKERRVMIQRAYMSSDILRLEDSISDEVWSKNLDNLLNNYHGVIIYGSRDSFIPYYKGKHVTSLLPEIPEISATRQRKLIGEGAYGCSPTRDFRAGIIYAVENRFPTAYPTVDIAVFRLVGLNKDMELLLCRKPGSDKFRFIGGFVDSSDESLICAAGRELNEEVKHMMTHSLTYVGSMKINDFRYRGTRDGIITTLFVTHFMGGEPVAADDIEEVRWFPVEGFDIDIIEEDHRGLFFMLKGKYF